MKSGPRSKSVNTPKKKKSQFVKGKKSGEQRVPRSKMAGRVVRLLHDHIKGGLFTEEKEVKGVRVVNEYKQMQMGEPDTSLASSLTSPNTVYMFKLQGFTTISTNGSGLIAVSIPMDPSASGFNFSEWANLAALFDEVKLHAFEVQVVGFVNTTVTLVFSPVIVGTNLIVSTAPGSEGAVSQLTDAKYHPANMTNSMGFWHRFNNTGIIGWSSTSSVTVTPYAGCPGSIWFYANNGPVSTLTYKVLVKGYYAFRARA